ncbi:hypothetical protein SAMN02745206_01678 [Desulfacinum infernum DSM 9756]|uniref:Uncharacterized protein n=1 Tax=Desulfacinum infernum DSM 9756 TaxID=1121391 RepID=A0A1M5ADP1_9BACT|nr:hypothetical protein [Desulfacinum infernum]SHF28399.1 hypothetical protein SAMN02745206_01678 [Desulfacinum infernum DSM 9756]
MKKDSPLRILSLCAPDEERSCFGCCPPIRPARYDPLDWVGSLKREFRDNRESLLRRSRPWRPVVGFSCWALGYLDGQGRRIGCLLHPAQNGGRDLRDAVGYRAKCAREQCLASRVFSRLDPREQRFWLEPAAGLNAFFYSSPRANPLFHVLLWGERVLGALASLASVRGWSATELVWRYPFLTDSRYRPRAHRFLAEVLLEGRPLQDLPENDRLEAAMGRLADLLESGLRRRWPENDQRDTVHVHRAGTRESFADFVRLRLGCFKAPRQILRSLEKEAVNHARHLLSTPTHPSSNPLIL